MQQSKHIRGRFAWVCAALVAGALAAVGCTHQKVTVTPAEIHHNVARLRAEGHAKVEVSPGGYYDLSTHKIVRATFKKRKLFGLVKRTRSKELPVSELIANCPDTAPFREDTFRRDGRCLLLETRSKALVVDTRLRPDRGAWKAASKVAFALSVLGGAGYCAAECDGPYDTVAAYSLLGLVALSLIPLAALGGSGSGSN